MANHAVRGDEACMPIRLILRSGGPESQMEFGCESVNRAGKLAHVHDIDFDQPEQNPPWSTGSDLLLGILFRPLGVKVWKLLSFTKS